MTIQVDVSNLGPIKAARQELGHLTIFLGENNSGKTFMATLCHRVLAAPNQMHPPPLNDQDLPKAIKTWLEQMAQFSDDQKIPQIEIDKELSKWAEAFVRQSLANFGQAVREGLEYAYGSKAIELCRRTARGRASGCVLRILNTEPSWRMQVRFDRNEVKIENMDIEGWIHSTFKPVTARRIDQGLISAFVAGELPNNFPFFFMEFSLAMMNTLFELWPYNAVHLPAGRTGIMHSHDLLASNIIQRASEAGFRPIEVAPLHGTAADFLSLMLNPFSWGFRGGIRSRDGDGYHARKPKGLKQSISQLEEEMRAKVELKGKFGTRQKILISTPEGQFPLSIVSSRISELAPLILVAKHSLDSLSHLTIDEPESHLHPGMQRLMADFLVSLSNLGIGILLTTHSDYLVSEITNALRVLPGKQKANGGKQMRPSLDISIVRASMFRRTTNKRGSYCETEELKIHPIDGIDQTTFAEVISDQYDYSSQLIDEQLKSQKNVPSIPTSV